MRFLLDQSTDARLLPYLRQSGHDAARIGSDYPVGLADEKVLAIAKQEGRILITGGRDFGEPVFRRQLPHAGVIFLRLGDYTDLQMKIARLTDVLTHYADQLDRFLVVTQDRVRVRGQRKQGQ